MTVQNLSKFSFVTKSFSEMLSGDRRFLLQVRMSPEVLKTRLLGMAVVGSTDRYCLVRAEQDWVLVAVGEPVVSWGVSSSTFYSEDVVQLQTTEFNVMNWTQYIFY